MLKHKSIAFMFERKLLLITLVSFFLSILAVNVSADIEVDPTSWDFGDVIVGYSSTKTVTISNTGAVDLNIGMLSLTGSNSDQFSIPVADDHCSSQTVVPSGICTVDVKFSPTSLGAKSSTLKIQSNEPDVAVPLEGTGPKVVLTSPNFEETLYSGTKWTITWKVYTSKPVAKVKLFFTKNGGDNWVDITTLSGNPEWYNWTVPSFPTKKKECKIKVILKDASNVTLGTDASNEFFTIKP